jgi:cyclopropane-fatty-acyl-phospholipid synthase
MMQNSPELLQQLALDARIQWNRSKPYRPNMAMRLILGMAKHIHIGRCDIVFPDGATTRFQGSEPGPEAICVIHSNKLAWIFLTRGILGFCEAYLKGYWSSPDMTPLFEMALLNEDHMKKLVDGHEWWRRIEGFFNKRLANTKTGSRRNIAYHYDLGNSFYKTWLDDSMTYSAGLFSSEKNTDALKNDPLQAAQENKYAHMAEMLHLKPDHHVLEIGCGWGGFAEYAAGTIGCRVTGLTISQAQHDYAVERIARAGLADKVDIRLCDYRDVQGQYDRIASIEMFEAVGEKYWTKFFDTVHDRLLPGGIAAMQIITIAERHFEGYRRGADYIQKYIFPGGMLPTFTMLGEHVKNTRMQWANVHRFGGDYARTLAEWRQRFLANWSEIRQQGFDERFKRMWEQYLCYCEAGFRAGSIDVCQFSFVKPKD